MTLHSVKNYFQHKIFPIFEHLTPRWLVIAVGLLAACVLFAEFLLQSFDKDARMLFRRLQYLILSQTLVAALSIFVYNKSRIKAYTLGSYRVSVIVLWDFCRLFLICVCVLTQLAWVTALISSPFPVKLLFVAWCAAGIHLQYVLCALFLTLIWKNFFYFPSWLNFHNFRAITSFVYAIVICAFSIHGALGPPEVRPIEIKIDRLPPSLKGLVIAQLGDIHIGMSVGSYHVNTVVEITNSFNPDLIVINGDILDGRVSHFADALSRLEKLKATYGVYVVTGNHEYIWGNVDDLLRFLSTYDFLSLRNSHVKIIGSKKNDYVWLIGTDDIYADEIGYDNHGFNLDLAMSGIEDNHPRILVTHQPKAAQLALNSHYHFDLILSAHTHGGEFFPENIWLWLENPFFRGLYQGLGPLSNSQVYVTEGTMFWAFPFRLGSTMEISKLILT